MPKRFKSSALAISGCVLLLYLCFLTKTHYWDGVLFSINIEQVHLGQISPAALIHPNHLLYTAFGYGLYELVRHGGIAVRAITVLQVANAFLSATCALLLFQLARLVTQSRSVSLFAMLLFAFGATWWRFSTDADAYISPVLLGIITVRLVLHARNRSLVAACVCHTAGMLLHELDIFLYFPVLLAIWMQSRSPKKILLYGLGSASVVFVAYSAAFTQVDHRHYPTLFSWITSYGADTPVTRSIRQAILEYPGSYTKLFFGGKVSLARQFIGPTMVISLVLVAAVLGVTAWFWNRPQSQEANLSPGIPDPQHMKILWAWFLPFGLFLATFDPAAAFYKLFVWPPIVLLIAAFVTKRVALCIRTSALIAFVTALAAWNFGVFIWPHSHDTADPVLVLAQKLDREMPQNVTVYYAAFSPDDWYLDYFAPGRKWQALQPGTQLLSGPAAPVCLETTALAAPGAVPKAPPNLSWDLVNSQHNIRVRCWNAERAK